MNTNVIFKSIKEMKEIYHTIEYPEFQREASVWGLCKKRLLIDSILRNFDISSIYLFKEDTQENLFQCVDGRQRLNAIFSFLGINPLDKDNNFSFFPTNEVRDDNKFNDIEGCNLNDSPFDKYKDNFFNYKIRIIELSNIDDDSELNLQFQRLQVAQILSGSEKLNAMVGEMRDIIFKDFGNFKYFNSVGTRKGRYGSEQSATQVTLNVISYLKDKKFKRARFIDMQEFFKEYFQFTKDTKDNLSLLKKYTNDILSFLKPKTLISIKNRALVMSILLFFVIHKTDNTLTDEELNEFDNFINYVIKKLNEVSKKPIGDTPDIWEKLQLAITQASVEKSAIENRHSILTIEFNKFRNK